MAVLDKFQIWNQRYLFTKRLVFATLYISLAAVNFGYDTSLFSSVQGMQPFAKEFGEYDEKSELYSLPSYLSSVMNSTPFLGKLIGTLSAGYIMEKFGRKCAMLCVAISSLIGVVLQCASFSAAQFTVGRIVCYYATGVTISVVPTYQSETVPPDLRGALVSTIQLWIGVGQIIAAAVTNATRTRTGRDSWLLPTGLQFIVPALLIAGYWFVPESPRWLLWKKKRELAFKSVRYFRSREVTDESINYELDLIEIADKTRETGKWKDLFKGSDLRRAIIAVGAMFCQQITGQAFVTQYQVVFLQRQKITSPSPFALNIVSTSLNLIMALITSVVVDTFGRRIIIMVGSFFMCAWLLVLGGLGTLSDKQPLNHAQQNTMIASLLLFLTGFGISWAPVAYIIMGEVPTNHLREKTTQLATSVSVLTSFLTSFTVPYLLNAPYANLGAKVGYVYGSISGATFFFALFVIPEMKNRSLEELDEMFDEKVSVFNFAKYEVKGIGKQIHEVEGGRTPASEPKNGIEIHISDDKIA